MIFEYDDLVVALKPRTKYEAPADSPKLTMQGDWKVALTGRLESLPYAVGE